MCVCICVCVIHHGLGDHVLDLIIAPQGDTLIITR